MAIEPALIKPIVDALLKAFDKARTYSLKRSARATLSEAIEALLSIHPDEDKAHAIIAVAGAADIIGRDLFSVVRIADAAREKRVAKPYAGKTLWAKENKFPGRKAASGGERMQIDVRGKRDVKPVVGKDAQISSRRFKGGKPAFGGEEMHIAVKEPRTAKPSYEKAANKPVQKDWEQKPAFDKSAKAPFRKVKKKKPAGRKG